MLKLNANQAKNIHFDCDSYDASQKYLNMSMTSDFEHNAFLDDFLGEIMDTRCQDNGEVGSRRINFKIN